MKNSRLLGVLFTFIFGFIATPSHAVLIGTGSLQKSSTYSSPLDTGVHLVFLYCTKPNNDNDCTFGTGETVNEATLFNQYVTELDAGKHYYISANTHNDFPLIRTMLTNGTSDNFEFMSGGDLGLTSSRSIRESYFFFGTPPAADFYGYNIGHLEIVFNSITIDPPSDPSTPWSYTYDFTMNVYGSTVVPTPSALWLFSSGLLGLIGIARQKITT